MLNLLGKCSKRFAKTTKNFSNPALGSRNNPLFVQTINADWSSREINHHRRELIYWRCSTALSAFSSLVALVGVYLAFSAFGEAQRQADAAVQSNRPWIKFELQGAEFNAIPVAGLPEKLASASFFPHFRAKNIGKDVATNLYFTYAITEAANIKTQEAACEFVDGNRGHHRSVVFPDNIVTEQEQGGVFGEGIPVVALSKNKIDIHNFSITFIGCFSYNYAGSKTKHHTSFSYIISHKINNNLNIGGFDVNTPVSASEIYLYEHVNSGSIID